MWNLCQAESCFASCLPLLSIHIHINSVGANFLTSIFNILLMMYRLFPFQDTDISSKLFQKQPPEEFCKKRCS